MNSKAASCALSFPGNGATRSSAPSISIRQGLAILLSIVLLSASVLFYSWARILVTHMGYILNSLKAEEVQQKSENQRLLLERLTLTSPEHLENLGLNKFKLGYPESWQVVDLTRPEKGK